MVKLKVMYVLSYDEALHAGAEIAGGKGWNLARLRSFGFPVPDGLVLAAEAYRHHLRQASIADPIARLQGTPIGSEALNQILAEVRGAIVNQPIPENIEREIHDQLESSGLSQTSLAVRSSATAEDGARTSFAGIHESRLNVTAAEVPMAVRECWASLWTERAVAYRRRFGLSDADVACAVVICTMIQGPEGVPLAAGVAFSCDPVTGRRDVIRISAIPGLGEALVSGSANPQDWTVSLERFQMSVLDVTGPPVLSPRHVERLAELVERLHWALGDGQDPQDIEWAFDGERYWLVQARPVTHLPRRVPEAIQSLPVIWSNANLKDVLPGVQSILSWSGTQPVVRAILMTNLAAAGYAPLDGMETLRRMDGRAYFDLTMLQWCYYDALGASPADMNANFGGSQPEIPLPANGPDGATDRRRKLAVPRLIAAVWRNSRTMDAEMLRVRAYTRDLAEEPLGDKSNEELIERLRELSNVSLPFARRFQLANGSTIWYGVLEGALEQLRPGQGKALLAGLMAGSGQVVSANQGYRVSELAAAARQDRAARQWVEAQPRDPQGWRVLDPDNPFRRALEAFLRDFGHRAVYELEIANPRWNEDPNYIVDQVRYALSQDDFTPRANTASERRRAAEAELDRLPALARPALRWMAEHARRASAHREASKSILVSVLEPMRSVALEAGRRLVRNGTIEHEGDVFHLSWSDLNMLLHGTWDGQGATALIAHRKRQRAAWLRLDPPDTLVLDAAGQPATLPQHGSTWSASPPAFDSSVVWRGVPAAAGRARGPARVIRHPDEGHRLQQGDVLVAPSTDPGWTPLFLRASAIVMEVGGFVSHGAIVAREYGIPAVVNVPGILSQVQDGQILDVDGSAGTVRRVDDAS